MAAWRSLLGGLVVWAAHFLTLYILGSVFGTSDTARLGVALATLVALAAIVALLVASRRSREADPVLRWMASLGTLAAGLAIVAIIWQAMPALLS